jgi:glycosyltransferase involved in cell wall biosynthesis
MFYGQSTRPYYLGTALSEIGDTILHLCPRPPHDRSRVTFVPLGSVGKNLGRKLITAARVGARSCFFDPDVIYVHQACWMDALGTNLARLLRKPVVLDIHGSQTQEIETHTKFKMSHEIEQAERRTLAAANKIVVVSPELKEFLMTRLAVPQRFLAEVPNGVDLSHLGHRLESDQIRSVIQRYQIPEANKIVTFTCPRNGECNETALSWFFRIVRAVNLRRGDITFLILGGGEIIPPPSDSVLYTGFVSDLPAVLAASDVCVLPYPPNTICGGVRNKALEYFAAGKPVVSTAEGMRGFSEAVPGKDHIRADEIEEFASRILELLTDSTYAETIGSNAKALAQLYNWSDLGRKIHAVLCSVLDSNNDDKQEMQSEA